MGRNLSRTCPRTGDAGTAGLGDGSRTAENSARVAAIGDVGELDSLIGVIPCGQVPAEVRELVTGLRHDLFDLGRCLNKQAGGGDVPWQKRKDA